MKLFIGAQEKVRGFCEIEEISLHVSTAELDTSSGKDIGQIRKKNNRKEIKYYSS